MKLCIAFRRAGAGDRAWKPCTSRAFGDSLFCRRHADALDGAVLGLLVTGFREEAEARYRAGAKGNVASDRGANASTKPS